MKPSVKCSFKDIIGVPLSLDGEVYRVHGWSTEKLNPDGTWSNYVRSGSSPSVEEILACGKPYKTSE